MNVPLFTLAEDGAGRFLLQGELTFRSAQSALHQVDDVFHEFPQVVFDLAGITRADSAGVGIMLAWLGRARCSGSHLEFVNLPEQLVAIAHVAGVDGMLRVV